MTAVDGAQETAGSSRASRGSRPLIAAIRWYQRTVSPGLPRRCRYYPTCSAYAVEALDVHGPVKGLLLAAWRLLRCNPLTKGGVDHVPEQGQWRYPHPHDIARFELEDQRG